MKLIQITDLHLVEPADRLFDADPQERLRLCLTDILTNHADADLLVVTGDLAHHGEPAAYAALKEAICGLPIRTRLLIGNHDDRTTFRSAFPTAPVDPNGFIQSVMETRLGRFLFLDTNEPGTHAGRYCMDRLLWLKDHLSTDLHYPNYLFMHHPPGEIGFRPCDEIGLRDAAAFADIFDRYPIRHVFFGHVHRPVSGSWRGVPFSALRGLNHQVWLDFSVADGIPCSLEPPAYAVILLDPENTIVHLHDFLDSSPKYLYRPDLPLASQVRPASG